MIEVRYVEFDTEIDHEHMRKYGIKIFFICYKLQKW